MTRAFLRRLASGAVASAAILSAGPVAAGTLFHRAESQVPVAIVEIDRTSRPIGIFFA